MGASTPRPPQDGPGGGIAAEAICFDMASTLLRHTAAGPGWFKNILGGYGYSYTPEELSRAHAPARELYLRATREGRDFEASMEQAISFWHEYNSIILHALGVSAALHQEIARRIYTQAWDPTSWELYPDVVPTLVELRGRGIRLALVSNFIDTLHMVCAVNGIAGYFDTIVCSVEVGAMKPDPRIFQVALRRMGVQAARAWHVGDNYWADVLGARAAGLEPVLIDRAKTGVRADCPVITTLDEVVDLIEERAAA